MENWLPVVGLEEFYEISDLGNLRSIKRIGETKFGKRSYGGKSVNPFVGSNGYMSVNLTKKGYRKQFNVHRLVLEAFVGKCPKGMEGCHNDGNKANCVLNNLRWDTRKNNHADKKLHGTYQIGAKNPYSKLTEEQAYLIKYSKNSLKELAKKYNVSVSCVGRIRYNITWTHI